MKDHFKEKSKNWDKGDVQVQGAKIIADVYGDFRFWCRYRSSWF
jgi:hypothetical protein